MPLVIHATRNSSAEFMPLLIHARWIHAAEFMPLLIHATLDSCYSAIIPLNSNHIRRIPLVHQSCSGLLRFQTTWHTYIHTYNITCMHASMHSGRHGFRVAWTQSGVNWVWRELRVAWIQSDELRVARIQPDEISLHELSWRYSGWRD